MTSFDDIHPRDEYELNVPPPSRKSVALKIATAFCTGTYPLSEEGQALKSSIVGSDGSIIPAKITTAVLAELPTVEDPHPELFKPLILPTMVSMEEVLLNLATVQITKGCSHQCGFCAAGAHN